jgi:predicted RNase H-like HicB family nuclease
MRTPEFRRIGNSPDFRIPELGSESDGGQVAGRHKSIASKSFVISISPNCSFVMSAGQEGRSFREKQMEKKYTAIIRKSKLEYVAICLELNVSARGEDLADVEKNLRSAIELYIEDIKENPETSVSPVSTDEFIDFLRDTEPEWYKEPAEGLLLRPLEVHEVPSYA